jgi:hypothetical protein
LPLHVLGERQWGANHKLGWFAYWINHTHHLARPSRYSLLFGGLRPKFPAECKSS